jgi:hypothetical protein
MIANGMAEGGRSSSLVVFLKSPLSFEMRLASHVHEGSRAEMSSHRLALQFALLSSNLPQSSESLDLMSVTTLE